MTAPAPMPAPVAQLVELLTGMPGVVAVALGGSRAAGEGDARSDWDLAVYYRGALDTSPLAALGTVHPPGSWGRIMNGGAWLRVEGEKVDVLLRDLDAAEHWTAEAEAGRYQIDLLLGYLAGLPTYSLAAELALGRTLRGALPAPPRYPPALASAGEADWRFRAGFSLEHARMRAERGDLAGAVGQAARAAVEAAHARLCRDRAWVLNEKRILERAGLAAVQPLFGPAAPREPGAAAGWVARVGAALDVG